MTHGLRTLIVPVGLSFLTAAALWYGCAIYNTSLFGPSTPADGGVDGGDGGVDVCTLVGIPMPPTTEGVGSNTAQVVMVFSSIDLGLGQGPIDGGSSNFGFNLDQVCTCPGPDSCIPQPNAIAHCDDVDGRDHEATTILAQLPSNVQAAVTNQINTGGFNVIVVLQQYNGTSNDLSLSMALYSSSGTASSRDAMAPTPTFNGSDYFFVDPDSLIVPYSTVYLPKYVDTNAYVTDGVLVGQFGDVVIGFPGSPPDSVPPFNIELTSAYFTGALQPAVDGGYVIVNGKVGGRWATSSFLSAAGLARSPNNGAVAICNDSIYYPVLKSVVCAAADLSVVPPDSGTLTSCNALSFALSFQGVPASIGGQADAGNVAPNSTCFDGGTDDCN